MPINYYCAIAMNGSDIEMNKNQLQLPVIDNESSAPTSPVEGQMYFDTSLGDKTMYFYNGSAWIEMDGSGSGVESFTNVNGTYISATTVNTAATGAVSVGTIDLSAANGTDTSGRFLSKDNVWAAVDTGVTTVKTTSGTYIDLTPTTATSGAVTVTAELSAVDGTSSTTTRFLSKDNTWDIPSYTTNTDETYTLPVDAGLGNSAVLNLTAGGTGSGIKSIVNLNGSTNTVKITSAPTSGITGGVTFDLQDDVTIATSLTISGTAGDALDIPSGKGTSALTIGTDPSDTLTTKSYVDDLVSGGLTFKGTFRADTGAILSGGNSGSFLYNCPGGAGTRVAVTQGDYYVVATSGGSFYCSGVTLDIGDAIIAVDDAAADSSDAADWSTISQGVTVNSFTNANGTYISAGTVNTNATGAVTVGTIDLSAVDGTSDTSTKFLSKDNTWDVPSYTTNTDAKYALQADAKSGSNVPLTLNGSDGGSDTTVNLTEGTGITLTRNSATQITIAADNNGDITEVKASILDDELGIIVEDPTGPVPKVGLDIKGLTDIGTGIASSDRLAVYDVTGDVNKYVQATNLAPVIRKASTYAATITAFGSVTHNLGSFDVIVQLYNAATYETVYACVERTSVNAVAISGGTDFPAGDIRVLVSLADQGV
jgi:hypothetical protein